MKNKNIYDALSGIDEKYIERSEDFEEIKAQFRRAKARKIGVLSSVCASLVIVVCAVGIAKNNYLKTPQEDIIEEVELATTETSTINSSIITTEISEKITTKKVTAITTVYESAEITTIIEVTEPPIEETSEPDNIIDETDYIPPVEIIVTTENLKGELPTKKPDDYDGINEILIYNSQKYFSYYDDMEEFTIAEFIGTVEQFHIGDYYYIEPDSEVYTIEESNNFLVVKDKYDSLFLFRIKEQS